MTAGASAGLVHQYHNNIQTINPEVIRSIGDSEYHKKMSEGAINLAFPNLVVSGLFYGMYVKLRPNYRKL